MTDRSHRSFPPDVTAARKQFGQWRQSRKCRGRIPEALWACAVRVASRHGVGSTARALGLNVESLKQRVESARRAGSPAGPASPFIELLPPGCGRECGVEIETPAGSKLRIVIKGDGAVDVAGLIERFWQVAS